MITRSKKRQSDTLVYMDLHQPKRKSKTVGKKKGTENIIDRNLELTDPSPDIHFLFKSLDARCFGGVLSKNDVQVEWSTSLDIDAVGCCATHGGRRLIKIELNERLLKYRTRRDLVETLLHEMIHASLAIDKTSDDHDDHGPNFLKVMNRIYLETGANASVYYNYSYEIALYENRLWKCNGKCRNRPPQFGLIEVKSHKFIDFEDQWWWSYHLKTCGGRFELVKSGD